MALGKKWRTNFRQTMAQSCLDPYLSDFHSNFITLPWADSHISVHRLPAAAETRSEIRSKMGSGFRRTKNQYLSAASGELTHNLEFPKNISSNFINFFSNPANLVMLAHGCAIGWFSPALPLLNSESTPLDSGPFTIEQTSWSGSILSLGGILGNIVFGYCMVIVGTKNAIMSFALPQFVSRKSTYRVLQTV